MRWSCAALLAALTVTFAVPATAVLPAGYELVVRGDTVDAQALPPLLALREGAATTIGLGIKLHQIPHATDDWVVYETGSGLIRAIRPEQFMTTSLTTSYFDPSQGRLRNGRVLPAGSDGLPIVALDGGASESLGVLLQAPGSVALFSVPESAFGIGLAGGALALMALGRRR